MQHAQLAQATMQQVHASSTAHRHCMCRWLESLWILDALKLKQKRCSKGAHLSTALLDPSPTLNLFKACQLPAEGR